VAVDCTSAGAWMSDGHTAFYCEKHDARWPQIDGSECPVGKAVAEETAGLRARAEAAETAYDRASKRLANLHAENERLADTAMGNRGTLASILPHAAAEIDAVLRFGADKHGDAWKTRDDAEDARHSAAHVEDCLRYRALSHDPETKRHHLAHAICRLSFILERELAAEEGVCDADEQGGA
jgi:hypothetical protein